MTLREALDVAERRLASAGIDTPRVDAELLLAHVTGTTRSGLYADLEREVDGSWQPLLERRAAREPLAYVLGEWGFRRLTLKTDQRALVKRAIDSGRFSHEGEAVREALALWEERERRRLEILASLDEAEASLARGEGRPITEESMKALADDVKQRGRTRLATERNASR